MTIIPLSSDKIIDFIHTSGIFKQVPYEINVNCDKCQTPIYACCPNCLLRLLEKKEQAIQKTLKELKEIVVESKIKNELTNYTLKKIDTKFKQNFGGLAE